ncbi:MAG: hypothetical protein RJA35_1085 [Actinomycetota bacterium]|jgi:Fe2+ transport system protein FeoA
MANTLHSMEIGVVGRVSSIRNPQFVAGLEVMGIRSGSTITKISKAAGRAFIVRVGDARVCIAGEISKSIQVDLPLRGTR